MSGTPEISTLLCFDFGTHRIGVAVGTVITCLASPLTIVRNKNNQPDWAHIARLLEEWRPDALVVGIPFNMRGDSQAMTSAAKKFMRQLKGRWLLPVYGADECLSSFEATQRTGKTKNIDAVAAQVILETWFSECHQKIDSQTLSMQDT